MKRIDWVKAARRDFEGFPNQARQRILDALAIAAIGEKADIAKPMKGLGAGVMEIALPYRSDAYRVVYVVQIAAAVVVVHAFQKKSKSGIATPKKDIDLIKARLRQIREMYK